MSLNTSCNECTPCLGKSHLQPGSDPDCHFKDEVKLWGPIAEGNNNLDAMRLRRLWDDYKKQAEDLKRFENNCRPHNSKAKCMRYINRLKQLKVSRDVWMKKYLDPRCHRCDWSHKNHEREIGRLEGKIQKAKDRYKDLLHEKTKSPSPKKIIATKTQKHILPVNRFGPLDSSHETRAKTYKKETAPKPEKPETHREKFARLTKQQRNLKKKVKQIESIETLPKRSINPDQQKKLENKEATLLSLERTKEELLTLNTNTERALLEAREQRKLTNTTTANTSQHTKTKKKKKKKTGGGKAKGAFKSRKKRNRSVK